MMKLLSLLSLIFSSSLLFIKLTKSQGLTTNFTNTTELLIKENATSNYFYSTFNFGTESISMPFAIGQCATYNILNAHLKAECISTSLLNVTYYNQGGCEPQYFVRNTIINDTSLFRCDVGSNYATILMSVGTACPGIFDLAVAVGFCHYTGVTYATLLCENNYLQYVYYNDSLCSSSSLMAINDINKTCNQFFTSNNINIYGAVQQCVTNLTSPDFTTPPTTTAAFMTTIHAVETTIQAIETTIHAVGTTINVVETTINTIPPTTTNVNASLNATSAMQSTAFIISTSVQTIDDGIRTSAAGAQAPPEPTTRRKRRIIPGIPTIIPSSASSIFNFNTILFIILIGSIVNIFC